ncbi:MAG: hypothetical protein AABX01_00680 [Candidatus Micrarchaeota archaeon]
MDNKSVFNGIIIGILLVLVVAGGYFVLISIGAIGGGPQKPTPTSSITTITPTPSVSAPKIDIIMLTAPECTDCFDIEAIPYVLQQNGAQVTQKKVIYTSDEGKALIGKFNVTKLPTAIVSGEISKIPEFEGLLLKAGEKIDGKFVLKDIAPPYLDLELGKIIGKIKYATIYDQFCFECRKASVPIQSSAVNFSLLAETLKEVFSIGIAEDIEYEANTTMARELIQKYKLEKLPAIIMSDDILAYPALEAIFANISTIESDGSYVLRKLNPPYLNLSTGKAGGLVSFVYIKAGASCEPECYDYTVHTTALNNLGVMATSSYYYDYDSSPGRNYTKMYNITKVPTVLISPEVKLYPAFMSVYKQIGDFEKDGWFVFRNFKVLEGAWFFDLTTNTTATLDPNLANQATGGNLPPNIGG